MLPDFNRLKVFYHIYNEQSSTAAARQLHITQSGVSQHLKKLEEEMQAVLFTRVKRRLVPTAAGIKLYEIVKGFMVELEYGVQTIHETTERPAGLLRIGAPSEFGKNYIPLIFASFKRAYPDVSLYLELGDPKHLFSMVAEGNLDFAYIDILPIFIDTPGGVSSYTIDTVVCEEFVLACSERYYNRYIVKPSFDTLVGLEFIAYKRDPALLLSWFDLHYGTTPSKLKVAFTVDSAQAIIAAIEEDLGLGITVSHLMRKQIAEGAIVPITITSKKLKNTIACVRFRDKKQTITETAFQTHLVKELGRNPSLLRQLRG
ncbi:LysR family transcriptional regulator [Desulforhopalus sp. IMCC35007]|uniref:LysR family transcriptional regulator n=1 Tax=Desulforhopalus sp. IMCC35007 TaxID=2569543 RepID=UPI0010AE34B6|nr:LysR family transcriptional regulator [Desulforhopalus sp. IMCC35007]TKB06165.1 LysR family transcriptional regulator [Desulforhopalus sp. IMCC35007]